MSPRSTRWIVKQKCDRTVNLLVTASAYMTELGVLYRDQHPEISNRFSEVVVSLNLCIEVIEKIRDSI